MALEDRKAKAWPAVHIHHRKRQTPTTAKGERAMNRKERRRQAAKDRHNSFVRDYVQHLPEVGAECVNNPGFHHMVCYHDDWCSIYDGGGRCNCNPIVKFHSEPKRS
jgi:hypothetical protein